MASFLFKASKTLGQTFLKPKNVLKPQYATLMQAHKRQPIPKPPPFDPKLPMEALRRLIDNTFQRFDDDTLMIVVEGAMASGKTKLAKELAERFNFHYVAPFSWDKTCINSYGVDYRHLNDRLPLDQKYFDYNMFLQDPYHEAVPYMMRLSIYEKTKVFFDAMNHVFNTGQGVVMDGIAYSEPCYLNAMYEMKYIRRELRDYFYEIYNGVWHYLRNPHLVIYLDCPPHKTMENVKNSGTHMMEDNVVYSPEYFAALEKYQKDYFLKDLEIHSQLLIYDWSEGGEVDVVCEDIEQIDFKRSEMKNAKYLDWANMLLTETRAGESRELFARRFNKISGTMSNVSTNHLSEFKQDYGMGFYYTRFMDSCHGYGLKYAKGYNEQYGDKINRFTF